MGPRLTRLALVVAILALGGWLAWQAPRPDQNGEERQRQLPRLMPGVPASGMASTPVLDASQPYRRSRSASPVPVRLAELDPTFRPPHTLYDRWTAGQASLDGIEGSRTASEMAALRRLAAKLSPSDQVQQASPAAPTGLNLLTVFDSLDYTECCGGGGTVPPDPDLAAGPNHLMAVVNVAFEVYDTNGVSLVGPVTLASFFNNVAGCNGADDTQTVFSSLFDPNVLYDEASDRFILAVDRIRLSSTAFVDGSTYCLAVSQTGDPTGVWNAYAFPLDESNAGNVWLDYPHGGVGHSALFMGGNMFTTGSAPSYVGGRVWAFDKNDLYSGNVADVAEASLGTDNSPQPLHLHGFNQGTFPTSGPHYIFTIRDDNAGIIGNPIYAWDDPFTGGLPSLVGMVDLDSATSVTAGMPVPSPQQGGTPIAANDWRPHDFEYRNGYAWTAHTIACNPGSGTVNCIRWAKINPSTAAVVDAGVYGSNGVYRSFPNLAVNSCEDMAIGYTKTSGSSYPAAWVNGRAHDAPPGQLEGEIVLKAGELPYTAFDPPFSELGGRRWGDYTGMTIAPDGQTFWYLGEYSKDTGTTQGRWGNFVGSFAVPECSGSAPLDHRLHLPLMLAEEPPLVPKAGFWQSTYLAHEFYVSSDSQEVNNYTVYVSVSGCGEYVITHESSAAINEGSFGYSGTFYVDGTFSSNSAASGTDGLDYFYIPGCGYVSSPGAWSWQASWVSGAQPGGAALRRDGLVAESVAADDGLGQLPPGISATPLDR